MCKTSRGVKSSLDQKSTTCGASPPPSVTLRRSPRPGRVEDPPASTTPRQSWDCEEETRTNGRNEEVLEKRKRQKLKQRSKQTDCRETIAKQ